MIWPFDISWMGQDTQTEWMVVLAIAGLVVLAIALWLRRLQNRFVAELRAAGDPLADARGSKQFRQRFQAWLFGLRGEQGGPAPGRAVIVAAMTGAVLAAALWSIWTMVAG